MRNRQFRSGFTLIEMLVVIAIIAVLAGILFPVLSGARAKAWTTTCASNLHQLGQAFSLYENDAAGYFPPWCVSNPNPNSPPTPQNGPDPSIATWDSVLVLDYLQGKHDVVVCIANPVPATGTGATRGQCRSYAMAQYTQVTKTVGGQSVYVGGYVARIPNPSQTVLLFEKGANLPGSWGDALGQNVHQSHGDATQADYLTTMFHAGGKNILFVDGSVKLFHEQEGPFAWDSKRTTPGGDKNLGPGVCENWGKQADGGDWPPLS